MRIAIIQPYFLPYIGYFQILNVVDRFIILDDVNFISRGWINRNRIAINGKPSWITIPLVKPSRNKLISDTHIQSDDTWKRKMLRSIELVYSKTLNFDKGYALIQDILDTDERHLSTFLCRALRMTCEHLGVKTEIEASSSIYDKKRLSGQKRILDICLSNKATHYVNPTGGRALYKQDSFQTAGVELSFLDTDWDKLCLQSESEEGPTLSILDLIMHNEPKKLLSSLNHCRLSQ